MTTTTTTPSSSNPLQSICHCGAITVTLSRPPEYVNECQCTICRRYAAAWAYYRSDELAIEHHHHHHHHHDGAAAAAGTKAYVWGDRDNEFHFCAHCGCVVYWWAKVAEPDGWHRVGVNSRNMRPEDVARVERRVQYDAVFMTLRDKAWKHREDVAEYA